MKYINKRNVLIGAILGGVPSLFLWFTHAYEYKFIFFASFIFLLSIFFSLITYKMRDQVFHTWRNFALFWIPLSIFFIAITPEASGILQVIDKELIAIVFSGLFVILSIIVISVSFVRNCRRGVKT